MMLSATFRHGAAGVPIKISRIRSLAALFSLQSLTACSLDQGELDAGDRAPAWTATTFAGDTVRFPDLQGGKPTVMVFWATWCSYCEAFMPYLERIHESYGADRINIVTINAMEDDAGDPAAYVADLGFPSIAVRDGDSIAAAYDVEYIPGLMIVDSDGIVAYRRAWTDLPAGETVANLWSVQLRLNLDSLLDGSRPPMR
jgi:thiol-disulfide isomerase/thioredoxin